MKVLADIISAPADGDKMSAPAMRNAIKIGRAGIIPKHSNSQIIVAVVLNILSSRKQEGSIFHRVFAVITLIKSHNNSVI